MTVSYITYAQLAEDCRLLISKLPRALILDLAGVVGIPRSGLLPAAMIANHLHLPLADSYSFVRCGHRFTLSGSRVISEPQGRIVLVVDDSIYVGSSMARAVAVLTEGAPANVRYVFSAIYSCPEKQAPVDYWAREVHKPRYFEWNLMQHPDMPSFMLDMDGVLCYDPVHDDDSDNYVLSLKEAKPLYLPRYRIGNICTLRLERHRLVTENWLAKHGLEYGNLTMLDVETADARRRTVNYGQWKGQQYKDSDAKLFIESDHAQAAIIQYFAGKPVICPTVQRIYQ